MPKSFPISRLSLSVWSNLSILSATRSASLGSENEKCWRSEVNLNLNKKPLSKVVREAPTNRSPSNCGPSPLPFTKPIGDGASAYFQLNSGSTYCAPLSIYNRESTSCGVNAVLEGGQRSCCRLPAP